MSVSENSELGSGLRAGLGATIYGGLLQWWDFHCNKTIIMVRFRYFEHPKALRKGKAPTELLAFEPSKSRIRSRKLILTLPLDQQQTNRKVSDA
ncbi:hypothetical protein HAX54_037652 [Datura stramonium]|uniref:Uncharacterized protein n=1 Tax=Datura stramonium TaxID=4076 RepID=A0ABS8SHE8_DATST|nr:hypothetical protein [Datura stramonium]